MGHPAGKWPRTTHQSASGLGCAHRFIHALVCRCSSNYSGLVLSSTFCAPSSVLCAALCVPFFALFSVFLAVFLVARPVSLAACLVSWPASFISCFALSCASDTPNSNIDRVASRPRNLPKGFTCISFWTECYVASLVTPPAWPHRANTVVRHRLLAIDSWLVMRREMLGQARTTNSERPSLVCKPSRSTFRLTMTNSQAYAALHLRVFIPILNDFTLNNVRL